MALIKCPECNKDISDKSEYCIHCGYPLSKFNGEKDKLFDVVYYGFENEKVKSQNLAKFVGQVRQLVDNKSSLAEARKFAVNPPQLLFKAITRDNAEYMLNALRIYGCVLEIVPSKDVNNTDNNKISFIKNTGATIVCPHCGSTAVTTGQRGFSLFTGFLGSNKTVNRCGKCGWSWEP